MLRIWCWFERVLTAGVLVQQIRSGSPLEPTISDLPFPTAPHSTLEVDYFELPVSPAISTMGKEKELRITV